jgi:hypothetical protein
MIIGSTSGDFVAHEIGCHVLGQAGAKALAGMVAQQVLIADLVDQLILADGDVLHLRRDDAAPRVMHLTDVGARLGHARRAQVFEAQVRGGGIDQAGVTELGRRPGQRLGVAALFDPARAHRVQALAQVDGRRRMVAAGVVTPAPDDLTAATGRARLTDLAHRHTDIVARSTRVNLRDPESDE